MDQRGTGSDGTSDFNTLQKTTGTLSILRSNHGTYFHHLYEQSRLRFSCPFGCPAKKSSNPPTSLSHQLINVILIPIYRSFHSFSSLTLLENSLATQYLTSPARAKINAIHKNPSGFHSRTLSDERRRAVVEGESLLGANGVAAENELGGSLLVEEHGDWAS
mmetsp:Transcript_46767/g.124224  ORF Transcript_46767/g.124224 Transcript_46767/m.124224 type:complete len:162 (+) Transcript_46767:164-649(+)